MASVSLSRAAHLRPTAAAGEHRARAAAAPRCAAKPATAADSGPVGRRAALQSIALPAAAYALSWGAATPPAVRAEAEEAAAVSAPQKVVVLGGNGFVGSRVCKALAEAGCLVVSVSRRGTPPAWAAGQPWVSKVTWSQGDVLTSDLSATLRGAAAVVSCIGTIGGSDESMAAGNGAVNVRAVQISKAAGVPKFVYISVASVVASTVDGMAMKGYFAGKREAEAALVAAYPTDSVVIRPSFIYGGEEFGLTPPRVTAGYGSGIEALLSSGPVRAIAGVAPGPIALTLAPPVSVESVAAAAAAGALGLIAAGVVDGTDDINAAAHALPQPHA